MKPAKVPETQGQLVLVQAIQVRWTKASRGAPGATARNLVPEGFALPLDQPGAPPLTPAKALLPRWHHQPEVIPVADAMENRLPDLLLHRITYGESNHFREPTTMSWIGFTTNLPEQTTVSVAPTVPPLTLVTNSEGLQVTFWWHEIEGAPPRRQHRGSPERLTLTPSQWGTVRFNARLSGQSIPWLYDKWVLNIGYATGRAPDLFVSGPSSILLSDMAELF